MTQPLRKKGGLGRGLASLIPTGPAEGDSGPATLGPRMGACGRRRPDRRVRRRPLPGWARCTARSRRPTSSPTRASRARCSTKRRCPSWCTRSASSVSCSRSWCERRPHRTGGARYQIVMGERRWRAAQAAGLTTIPAIVRETDDDNLLRDALLENIHRAQLNPLEEAAAYQQLLDEFGVTHDELAVADRTLAAVDHQHDPVAQTCRSRCSAEWPRGCCPPATPARCCRWTPAPRRRKSWRAGSSRKVCRCAPPRRP